MEAVGEAVEAVKDLKELSISDPHWILDRRNSGKLFWRRETASGDNLGNGTLSENGNRRKNRVKFRYEVEVLEFLKSEAERMEWEEEEEDQWRRKGWDHEIPPPSSFWGGVCALFIAAVLTYQWMSL